MSKAFISVIVPCYNVEPYIDRALESLRAQSFADFEIIAVDDGSTDGTAERLRRWLEVEPRLRIHRQENRGLYHARLSGIAEARGEWIAFMDADDELESGHLAGLWSGTAKGIDVVVTGITAVDLKQREHRYGPRVGDMTGEQAAVELLVGYHSNGLFPCWNKLYRRRVLIEAELRRPRINWGEDQIFNLRVFRAARGLVRGVAGHTYRYIARPGSIMRSISERHVDDFCELWRERDEVASALLKDAKRWRAYRHRKMLSVMDFAGGVFRSESRPLMERLNEGLHRMAVSPALTLPDAVAAMRWVKWKLRMAHGCRGSFPGWLR